MKEREIIIKDSPLRNFDDLGPNIIEVFTKYSGCPKDLRGKEIVFHNVNGKVPHKNFAEYLKIAYNTDYGIVIKPDFIWFTILNEISQIITKDPEKYRKYFTKQTKKDAEKNGKINIIGSGDSMYELPVHQMMELALGLIPSGLKKEDIIPPFSTSDDDCQFAFAVSFLETVSPYYGLMYAGCMYNKIKILGEPKDYRMMSNALSKIDRKIEGLPDGYISQLHILIDRIASNFHNDEFWKHILWTESGYLSDNIDGWVLGLYNEKKYWNDHISKIEYKETISNIDYVMVCGLLSSKIEDGYMIPSFQRIIAKKEGEVPPDEKGFESFKYEDGEFDRGGYRSIFSVATDNSYKHYREEEPDEIEIDEEP